MNMKIGALSFLIILLFSIQINSNTLLGSKVEIKILNKITAKVKVIKIQVNESINFESLHIEIYRCYKTAPEEIPENFVLLKILENNNLDNQNLIYQGWMISSSPASTPLEHPIYDLWLSDCKIETDF